MAEHHFEIINPRVLRNKRRQVREGTDEACTGRGDAAVCTNGNSDVTCTGERYRGCQTGQTDCANSPENPDDNCCWGWGPGNGDNIDHATCITSDAGWGGAGDASCVLLDRYLI